MQRGTKGFVGEVRFPESWGEFVHSAVGVIAQTLQDVYQIVISNGGIRSAASVPLLYVSGL